MTGVAQARSVHAAPVTTCYLCGSPGRPLHADLRDDLFGVPGLWSVLRCTRCELVWTHPRPRSEEIHKLYERYYTHSPFPDAHAKPLPRMGSVAEDPALPQDPDEEGEDGGGAGFAGLLKRGLRRLGPFRERAAGVTLWLDASQRGRLLDVGCGNGRFLARMRDAGWDVHGVEPDPVAAETARGFFGLQVTCAPLQHAALPEETFDVITLSHVVEHVYDPIGLLIECARLLKPDGQLVVVTPNSGSLGRRWFGRWWRGWEVPRHLFIFSPRTLQACAERSGLRVDEIRTTARSARPIWEESRQLRLARSNEVWVRPRSIAFWFVEHLLSKAAPCGEEILMIAGPLP
ncbi:MAG: class I SAM-dependent methyltransferase [Actinomycetota bacterium]|nr:class I SAM-dependent methyltransferase [Actinomycetota bacterium]